MVTEVYLLKNILQSVFSFLLRIMNEMILISSCCIVSQRQKSPLKCEGEKVITFSCQNNVGLDLIDFCFHFILKRNWPGLQLLF